MRLTNGHKPLLATKNDAEILVHAAVQRDRDERELQAAFNKMTRSIKCRPGGRRRWIFDQTSHGTYRPWRSLTEPIDMAIEAGAPQQDVQAITLALALYITGRYRELDPLPCVKEALRLEAHLDADADRVQADALADPSPSNLERVVEATTAHERAEETLVHACFRHLGISR